MRQATLASGMLENPGSQLGTEMLDTQFATQMTGMPGGLSDLIARQLERQMGTPAATAPARPHRRRRWRPSVGLQPSDNGRQRQVDFVRTHAEAAQAAEAETGMPAAFVLGAGRARDRLGPARDPQR